MFDGQARREIGGFFLCRGDLDCGWAAGMDFWDSGVALDGQAYWADKQTCRQLIWIFDCA
jgi:hypothetical protein